jgi:hypothetical protein
MSSVRTRHICRPAKCLDAPAGCGQYAVLARPDSRGGYVIRHTPTCPVELRYRATEQVRAELIAAAMAEYRAIIETQRATATPAALAYALAATEDEIAAKLDRAGVLP